MNTAYDDVIASSDADRGALFVRCFAKTSARPSIPQSLMGSAASNNARGSMPFARLVRHHQRFVDKPACAAR